MKKTTILTNTVEETQNLGEAVGSKLRGGEVLEFISDLGGGKTTFVRGLAKGFGSTDPVASPSFTISYVYNGIGKKQLHHFDFYRLSDAGIVANELSEVEGDPDIVVAVEWGEIVHDFLPKQRIVVHITAQSEEQRSIQFTYPEEFAYLFV
jgi:tRNA threonylcarbamoyladenosine biosynthesis protein TsaE